ncbi:Adenylate kinase [Alteromonadaceae bacterium Bs31]|nr:Adenylate kinase [Alteromonadaceae bacterium Bs31]
MKKVAIFGKPGSGKSTLARRLASVSGLPLHPLDSILYKSDGQFVERESYDRQHTTLLSSENWIIDGLGPLDSFYKRLEAADTLIYIDLPYSVSYYFVTKRLIKGLLIKPEGWPEGSSVLNGTLQSYKVLKRCPKFWNNAFLQRLQKISVNKKLHIIRSTSGLKKFIPGC